MPRSPEVVVISDVHLGTYGAHARELNIYLKSIQPKYLILNGDIIDIWQFRKKYWPASHMETIRILLDFIEKGTQIYYLTGNHDDMLRKFSDFKIRNFQLLDKMILSFGEKKAWIFHGDIFDLSVKYSPWLAKLGGKSYDYLILLNRLINNGLMRMGKEPISLSKKIKNSVKRAVRYVQDFERIAVEHALSKKYDYVICGHIHQPKYEEFKTAQGKVTYLNSGDWVENLTALEYENGEWSIFRYYDHFEPVNSTRKEPKEKVEALFDNGLPLEVVV